MEAKDIEINEITRIANDKITWFETRANACMRLFWVFSVLLGLSSTSLPLFALFTEMGQKNYIVAGLSVLVAFCSFMLQIGNYHMLWQNYRRSEFALRRLRDVTIFHFRRLNVAQETDSKEVNKLLQNFYAEFEEIETAETSTYFTTLSPAKDVSPQ